MSRDVLSVADSRYRRRLSSQRTVGPPPPLEFISFFSNNLITINFELNPNQSALSLSALTVLPALVRIIRRS